jgi:glucose/arabinose dehydrogenase
VVVLLAGCASDEPVANPNIDNGASEGPSKSPDGSPSQVGPLELGLKPMLQGLDSPLLVTNAGDGSGRLFVVQQTGQILVVENGKVSGQFLDISQEIVAGGEQGLLGLAFHPNYETNGRFFVDYTDRAGDTVIAEYTSDPGSNEAQFHSERRLLHIDQPYPNHNGGNLAFGPDGYLYIGMGDGGSGGDPQNNGQSLDTMLGKMLRIDVDGRDGDLPYAIPEDNPLVGRSGALPEIWAIGLRNPWRFSFDGDVLWIGDVGQDEVEEVDRVNVSNDGLYNFGWRVMEADRCYYESDCDPTGYTLPVAFYPHDAGCSVTGGYAYRGDTYPALQGTYVFGDYCTGDIWGLDADEPGEQKPKELLLSGHTISSFGVDEAGELYVTDLAGEVLQVIAK